MKIFISAFVLSFILLFSCNPDATYREVDCTQCYRVPPDSAYLHLKLTINSQNSRVPVTVYRDNFERGAVRYRDTLSSKSVRIPVAINYYYSVTAEYIRNQDTIIAVDGDRIKTKEAVGQCDSTCWVVVGGYLDVRLKRQ